MKTLHRLWECAKNEAVENQDWRSVFGEVGLFLHEPLCTWDYRYTPTNSSTFASTGGDGVHYGLLHTDGNITKQSPVVMTVPFMFDKGNLIVGGNLREFLCLGGGRGYFYFEQLLYDWDDEIEKLSCATQPQDQIAEILDYRIAPPYSVERERYLLTILSVTFDLHPINEPATRLKELNERYLPLLQLAPEED